MRPWGLYVHIPYCRRRCSYCDFTIRVGQVEAEAPRYVKALLEEARGWREQLAIAEGPSSIYFGGGTPSLLPAPLLVELLEGLWRIFGRRAETEVTVEANPDALAESSLRAWREAGVNRLSLGVQSFDPEVLRAMRRSHEVATVEQVVFQARRAGFDNLNLDLIYGWPGQDLASWQDTVEAAILLEPTHLSCYQLQVEPLTPLGRWVAAGQVMASDDELVAAMAEWAERRLSAAGFSRYEISNYARPGWECRHNLLYWRLEPYLGLGVGAHSYWQGRRWWNLASLPAYLRRLEAGEVAREGLEELDQVEAMRQFLWLGLRELRGVRRGDFRARFGRDWDAVFPTPLRQLVDWGLLEEDSVGLRLTARGRDLANVVARQLVDAPDEGPGSSLDSP
ncbi:MAG: radical SAM family heme chaperone HemW [Firmicutes bacterium]|nr:radical SAM family heme chaperone HemW [Bacillota bacterium]